MIISTPVSGDVDIPETAMTLQLLIDRAFTASEGVMQVAAKTPGNLLANMDTPTPVPQARRPRVSTVVLVEAEAELTRRPTFSPAE